MKRKLILLTLLGLLVFTLGVAARGTAKEERQPRKQTAARTLTPDQLYKANCTRCHSELPRVSERASVTVLRHMRVRANLTAAETKAILQYLND